MWLSYYQQTHCYVYVYMSVLNSMVWYHKVVIAMRLQCNYGLIVPSNCVYM